MKSLTVHAPPPIVRDQLETAWLIWYQRSVSLRRPPKPPLRPPDRFGSFKAIAQGEENAERCGRIFRRDKKTSLEECRFVDVRDWNRRGLLGGISRFSRSWSRDGTKVADIGVFVMGNSVTSYAGKLVTAG